LDDDDVLLDVKSGLYFSFSDCGSVLWEALNTGVRPASLISQNPARSIGEIGRFLQELLDYNLLAVRTDATNAELSEEMRARLARTHEAPSLFVLDSFADPFLSGGDALKDKIQPWAFGRPGSAQGIDCRSVVSYARNAIEKTQAAATSFSRRITVELPDLIVEVHTFDGIIADAIERNLHRASAPNSDAERMTIFIAHPGLKGIPAPAPWTERAPHWPYDVEELLAAANLKASHLFNSKNHWHIYDPQKGVAVELALGKNECPPWQLGAPLRLFLHWHYAARGKRIAHCGTLGIDGAGIILGGSGGSGKSGAVMAGLLAGLQSVGDDYVLIEAEPEITAHPLFSVLKQDAEGVRRLQLDHFVRNDATTDWQGKYDFLLHDITGQPAPSHLAIKAIVIPRVTGNDRSEVMPLSRRDAMLAFGATSVYQMHGDRESDFRFFSGVVNRLPCFRLDLGRDPSETAATIASLIRELRS
jgi:hypothetical protein